LHNSKGSLFRRHAIVWVEALNLLGGGGRGRARLPDTQAQLTSASFATGAEWHGTSIAKHSRCSLWWAWTKPAQRSTKTGTWAHVVLPVSGGRRDAKPRSTEARTPGRSSFYCSYRNKTYGFVGLDGTPRSTHRGRHLQCSPGRAS
jgi:hypothetical protein